MEDTDKNQPTSNTTTNKKKPTIKKKKDRGQTNGSSNVADSNNNASTNKKRTTTTDGDSNSREGGANKQKERQLKQQEEVFDDPFEDEFEEEAIYDDWVEEDEEGGEQMEDQDEEEAGPSSSSRKSLNPKEEEEDDNDDGNHSSKNNKANIKVWRPGQQEGQNAEGGEEELEYDNAAYEMLHQMRTEWPCLSFAVFPDPLGSHRTKYPVTSYLISGTQADHAHKNQLVILKASSLCKTKHDDDSDADDDDDDLDEDPILESKSIPHPGSVNRVKVMPQAPHVVATWSEDSNVYLWNVNEHVMALDKPPADPSRLHAVAPLKKIPHSAEGFAVDWNPIKPGRLITGDGKKFIFLTESGDGSTWVTDSKAFAGHTSSVEDLQWSPTEQDVFASCSSDKTIKIWDVRMKKGAALSFKAANCDVNVLSWNKKVTHLMLSGADDGSFSVWDLRDLKNNGECTPIGRFAWHTDQITSVEWDPNDESSLAVASADNQVTLWDLSVEKDTEEGVEDDEQDEFPPQLLFYHHQKDVKEVHFHPQIPGLLIATGEEGLSFFKPNITPEEGEEASDEEDDDEEDDN